VDYLRNKFKRIEAQILENLKLSSRVGEIDLSLVSYQMEQVRIPFEHDFRECLSSVLSNFSQF
jgi:cell fate (sporulation/competence/biofilm development) regulator YmcA (YheA/YmcA/DUF963 family)